MQKRENGQRARISYEEWQRVMYLWLPAKEEEVQEETEKVLNGIRFGILAEESEQVFSRRRRPVSPHEGEQECKKGKKGDALEEEFKRVFGESTEEVVERERRGEVGEEAARTRARKTEAVPSMRRSRGAQLRPLGVPELVPALCEGKGGVVWTCEESAK